MLFLRGHITNTGNSEESVLAFSYVESTTWNETLIEHHRYAHALAPARDGDRSKVKKLKKSEIRAKTDKKEKKEVDKKQPKTAKSEEVQQKTPVSKTTEEKTHEDKPANVMTIPKYQAAPLPAGSEQPKKGCCVLL
ncbi:hypothetical protein Y032_0459g1836 [Ancylostoma ceylanicum]|uniref:Uncharacterized protein n=1 Tax=Ancylostoma ceylanicum TaxID=53326 RepID=A0A016WXH7_9BILA|nr:hypothetical protein Y032_0459g1836 [Ancylostoma ceylanicum]